ncbi:hypothetical protein [Actinacidiphila epipremni]|jgi:hypothetical protein|uniref:Uncharacterized protein n=1 Tax=Actinacidiphila epipremni TaxID=2053013 RepID=A0ABX0ZJV8_9ACTN|nr:hypothetical protein [Actinacidiphila epipremni]NJP41948.1 hypothetical protein [Actinacidiphila epipremni]
MSQEHQGRPAREGDEARTERPRRPARLTFEPGDVVDSGGDRFFELESMEDPRELLARATELEHAFRTAAERAAEFQAVAAAQLTDARRFDRLSIADLAGRAGWSEDYAKKMAEWGRGLIAGGGVTP